MSTLNGITKENSQKIIEKLNEHLANLAVSNMNIKGYHWNVVGSDFFELHEQFDELYASLSEMIDGTAERIVTLGFEPHHSFEVYLKNSTVQPKTSISEQKQTVQETIEHLRFLIGHQRELIDFTAEMNDPATSDLLTGYLAKLEKSHWMFAAYLGRRF